MPPPRKPWHEELSIIDGVMKAISGVTDPEELVGIYWQGIHELLPMHDYLSASRRDVEPPGYLITRSSRFEEDINPWLQRERLPRMSGGVLGEIVYGNKPVFIEDLPARLSPDDPAWFYLQGFQTLLAFPHYERGESINVTMALFPPGVEIDYERIPMIHWQSALFGRGTQNLVLRNQLSAALAALDRELQAVGEIQRSLLPSELPKIEGFDVAADYRTSARAGGDYYDFFPLADGEWGLFIADVSGHGTPAAVFMAITHAIAHAKPGSHTPPAKLLGYLNDRLVRSYTRGAGTFVTAFYAVLDPEHRTLTYARAGHNPPRLVRGNSVTSLEQTGGLPLGIVDGQDYGEATISLDRGDLLLLYTDGITEAMTPANGGAARQMFGAERLDELLVDCGAADAAGCVDRVRREVTMFSGNATPKDDQTLIAIRCV